MAIDWDGYISLHEAARQNDHCVVHCINDRCQHSSRLDFEPLLERFDKSTSLGKILKRLRCQACKGLGATPIMQAGSKQKPPTPLFCPIEGRQDHRCDKKKACQTGCRFDTL
ncbi:hypothetical protein AUQ43_18315 [Thalassospira sp. MCCC 1A01148]|uniref:Uncharacterized protein n=1 Tax=Thalassospira profundimaris TaxID=502049 RepID=A0A367V7D4_9PROT|nr:hypothetical protein AUQ43_18315 [Thalassospira sp. MCCC 1A01148]RCK21114.1 hypothetical protein TH6_15285 [Thalassospira profundimaris]